MPGLQPNRVLLLASAFVRRYAGREVKAYFDSGVIVKLYVPEPNSEEAIDLVRGTDAGLPFSQLHEDEVKNAIRLKRRRKELSDTDVGIAFRRIHEDLTEGRLYRPRFDWPDVWTKAERFSDLCAQQVNCRTLNTLHVALATVLGFSEFVSFDLRQRDLAAKVGLHVRPCP